MIQFSAWTGLRAGELHALRWDDIGSDTIRVRGARKRDGDIGKPKNGKERTVAYLPPARVLDQVSRQPDGFVFHSPRGNTLVQGSHHYAWRTVRAASQLPMERESAGIPNVRWHDLRHFCATQLLELGLDHFAVSVQLGHEDGGALVMARYGHPSKDAARQRLMRAFEMGARGTHIELAGSVALGSRYALVPLGRPLSSPAGVRRQRQSLPSRNRSRRFPPQGAVSDAGAGHLP